MARDECAKSTKFTKIMKVERKIFLEAIRKSEKELEELFKVKAHFLGKIPQVEAKSDAERGHHIAALAADELSGGETSQDFDAL